MRRDHQQFAGNDAQAVAEVVPKQRPRKLDGLRFRVLREDLCDVAMVIEPGPVRHWKQCVSVARHDVRERPHSLLLKIGREERPKFCVGGMVLLDGDLTRFLDCVDAGVGIVEDKPVHLLRPGPEPELGKAVEELLDWRNEDRLAVHES